MRLDKFSILNFIIRDYCYQSGPDLTILAISISSMIICGNVVEISHILIKEDTLNALLDEEADLLFKIIDHSL